MISGCGKSGEGQSQAQFQWLGWLGGHVPMDRMVGSGDWPSVGICVADGFGSGHLVRTLRWLCPINK